MSGHYMLFVLCFSDPAVVTETVGAHGPALCFIGFI